MRRSCERAGCGEVFEAKSSRRRYCSDSCRVLAGRARRSGRDAEPPPPPPPPSDKVQGPLGRELQQLEVADSYEGAIALGLAAQLDSGAVTGTAYVSLSKELDRRVDELRRRAPKPDDETQTAKSSLGEKRLRLA